MCKGQTPGTLHVEQTAINDWKRLVDDKLYNVTCCESISWSPTLADNIDILEHSYAAKQQLVNSIWGMRKGDLETGMQMQQPMMDITCSIGTGF